MGEGGGGREGYLRVLTRTRQGRNPTLKQKWGGVGNRKPIPYLSWERMQKNPPTSSVSLLSLYRMKLMLILWWICMVCQFVREYVVFLKMKKKKILRYKRIK